MCPTLTGDNVKAVEQADRTPLITISCALKGVLKAPWCDEESLLLQQ